MTEDPYMIFNGEFVTETECSISPINRGMMYGDGCFETLRYYSGKLLKWDDHFIRLKAGLKYLGMKPSFTSAGMKKAIHELASLNSSHDKEVTVRIQCWRSGERGYKTDSKNVNWMAQMSEISLKNNPMKLVTAKTPCIPSKALSRRYKLSNGLNYIKAAQEAANKNADDSLMLTVDKMVSEATSANVFWIKKGMVFTPDENCDLLPGVTRSIVMSICKDKNIPFEEGRYPLAEMMEAEAAFCTNSLIELGEISALDDRTFQLSHAVFNRIGDHFEAYRREQIKK